MPAPPGSESVARQQGLPRNLGDLDVSCVSTERRREGNGASPGCREVERRSRSDEVGEPKPEGTRRSKGRRRESEPIEGKMGETQSSPTVCTKLERIASIAKEKPGAALTTLAHHIDVDWLREAFRRTRKDGARGVDGRSAQEYGERL